MTYVSHPRRSINVCRPSTLPARLEHANIHVSADPVPPLPAQSNNPTRFDFEDAEDIELDDLNITLDELAPIHAPLPASGSKRSTARSTHVNPFDFRDDELDDRTFPQLPAHVHRSNAIRRPTANPFEDPELGLFRVPGPDPAVSTRSTTKQIGKATSDRWFATIADFEDKYRWTSIAIVTLLVLAGVVVLGSVVYTIAETAKKQRAINAAKPT